MATTTTTLTTTRPKTHRVASRPMTNKPSSAASNLDDPVGNVKSLYGPAARAFVRRDVALTQTLLEAAFATLDSHPSQVTTAHDPMANLRRKWDLLRITLETTVYTSTSSTSTAVSSADAPISMEKLAPPLNAILSLQPSMLIDSLLERSLKLWAPDGSPASVSYLPVSIISALVFAALKVDCADAGRNLIETWLSQRAEAAATPQAPTLHLIDLSIEGYEKILDVYCLQVLPRLGEWEYAMEFLKYEPELSVDKRKHIFTSLKTLHTQVMNPPTPATRISRSSSSSTTSSPSPSSSSSSSGTATPNHLNSTDADDAGDARSASGVNGVATSMPRRAGSSLSNSSFSSQSSQQTVKASQMPHSIAHINSTNGINGDGLATANGSGNGNGTHRESSSSKSRSRSPKKQNGGSRSPYRELSSGAAVGLEKDGVNVPLSKRSRSGTGSSRTALPLIPASTSSPSTLIPSSSSSPSSRGGERRLAGGSPSVVTILREWFSRSLGASADRNTKIALVFLTVVLPLVGFIARLRMRRRLSVSPSSPAGSRKLISLPRSGNAGSSAGMIRWLFEAVRDSVVMAGKGLV